MCASSCSRQVCVSIPSGNSKGPASTPSYALVSTKKPTSLWSCGSCMTGAPHAILYWVSLLDSACSSTPSLVAYSLSSATSSTFKQVTLPPLLELTVWRIFHHYCWVDSVLRIPIVASVATMSLRACAESRQLCRCLFWSAGTASLRFVNIWTQTASNAMTSSTNSELGLGILRWQHRRKRLPEWGARPFWYLLIHLYAWSWHIQRPTTRLNSIAEHSLTHWWRCKGHN